MKNIEALGDEIAAMAAQLEAGEYRLLTKIGEFDAQGGYAQHGAISCAHWLSYRIGLGLGPAREKVRVARALPNFPLVARAFESARLSYSKVRAITRVATPENEEMLVDMGMSAPASVLESLCRKFRKVRDTRETVEEADRRRTVQHHFTDHGKMRLDVQLDADEGARVLAALEIARGHVSAETRATTADALMIIVDGFLADGPKARAGGPPTEVRLHVEKAELEAKSDGAFVENAGCLAVPAETARRLCCDAAIVEVEHDASGKVIDTKPRSRKIPAAMRRALDVRDQHRCRFPGCTHTLFVEAHHIIHFAVGGATELKNLVNLCRRHHTFVHEYGYTIVGDVTKPGPLTFVAPGRRSLMTVLPPPPRPSAPIETLAQEHADRGLSLDAVSLLPPHWDGKPADTDWVISRLCDHTFGVPAEKRPARPTSLTVEDLVEA